MTAFIIGLFLGLIGAASLVIGFILHLKKTGYVKLEATDKLIALLKS